MNKQHQIQALLLIFTAEEIIGARRKIEAECDYPSEYGGDELLHKRLKTFLNDSAIHTDLKELLKKINSRRNE